MILAALWLATIGFGILYLHMRTRGGIRKACVRFLLSYVPVEDRAREVHKRGWKDEFDMLAAVDDWSTDCCPEGCTSTTCCDWRRLYILVSTRTTVGA